MFSNIDQVLRAGVIAGDHQEIQPVDPREAAATLIAAGLLIAGIGIALVGAGLYIVLNEQRFVLHHDQDRR